MLKPGGTFACFEFNKVTSPLLARYAFLSSYSLSLPYPPFPSLSQVPYIRLDSSRLYEVHDFTRFIDGRLKNAISEEHIAIADFEVSVERN